METNSSLDFFNTLQAFSAATNFSLVVVNRQGQVISDFLVSQLFAKKCVQSLHSNHAVNNVMLLAN